MVTKAKGKPGKATIRLEAIASRVEAIASRLEAIPIRLEAIAISINCTMSLFGG